MRHVLVTSIVAILLMMCPARPASAQQCPLDPPNGTTVPSQTQSLPGRLIYHDGIRKWFELRLDHPQCGQASIELVELANAPQRLARVRGCHVTSVGQIAYSLTGYFSLAMYEPFSSLHPDQTCAQKPPFPDHSHDRPNPRVRAYTVTMHVNYTPGDHPIRFGIRSGKRRLEPWQAYADYDLTGGFVLWGHCGKGFAVTNVSGPRAADPDSFSPGSPDNMASYDPEGAAQAGLKRFTLGYGCVRLPGRGQ